ncbi:MAG: hypothetical protein ACK4NY_01555 [Spirosomataceae bacterium]
MQKFAITLAVILYAVVVPILEINDTHVFSPDWIPHAKIHEVWQLITNSSIGILCLWLTWRKAEYRLSIILSMIVTGGFLLAFILKDFYGGDMRFQDGTEKAIGGINIGILGFGIAIIFLIISLFVKEKKHV